MAYIGMVIRDLTYGVHEVSQALYTPGESIESTEA